jgi:hypothetical protein
LESGCKPREAPGRPLCAKIGRLKLKLVVSNPKLFAPDGILARHTHIFSPTLFSMLVLMALITTMMTTPILNQLGIQK